MNDTSRPPLVYKPANKVRFVTAALLFDGHDASINIMRRILQATGCEVIHLGHNRSVDEIVNCAIQEDAHGIAISSYQGGHVEFFKYMLDLLRERGAPHIKVFGGGGGVIVPGRDQGAARLRRRAHLLARGRAAARPAGDDQRDRRRVRRRSRARPARRRDRARHRQPRDARTRALARMITGLEAGTRSGEDARRAARGRGEGEGARRSASPAPAARARARSPTSSSAASGSTSRTALRIAIVSIDPSRRKSGGALLGDRIRMNAIEHPNIYMRSLATRDAGSEVSKALPDVIAACKVAGFDLVIVETSGIGQGDAAIVPLVDVSLYVMTPEFGAASQLEKIDMLDFADFVAINKFDRKGAQDALRDVRKQVQRNREQFNVAARRRCRCSARSPRASTTTA